MSEKIAAYLEACNSLDAAEAEIAKLLEPMLKVTKELDNWRKYATERSDKARKPGNFLDLETITTERSEGIKKAMQSWNAATKKKDETWATLNDKEKKHLLGPKGDLTPSIG